MVVSNFLEAAAADLRPVLGERVSVITSQGPLNAAALSRIAAKAPLVALTCRGFLRFADCEGDTQLDCVLGAYVVATTGISRGTDSTDSMARTIAESIAAWLTHWPPDDTAWSGRADLPTEGGADSLWDDKLADKGLALWLVTWQQAIYVQAAAEIPWIPRSLWIVEDGDPPRRLLPTGDAPVEDGIVIWRDPDGAIQWQDTPDSLLDWLL